MGHTLLLNSQAGDPREGVPLCPLGRSPGYWGTPGPSAGGNQGTEKRDHFEPMGRKLLHMTNDETRGYVLGPESRVVLHRNAARGSYAVAVVIDEGPYRLTDARNAAARIREDCAGWVSKADAAERLGVSERQVDYLREQGRLSSTHDETSHVLISSESLEIEIQRREANAS